MDVDVEVDEVVVEVDVHRGQHEMMVLVLQLGEAFGQVAGVMAVDVGKRSHAIGRFILLQARRFEFVPEHVAHGFGAVLVTLLADQFIELPGKVLVQRNGKAIHSSAPLIVMG